MDNLGKRKELTGLFTFFAANYPQYELEIDNNLAMQKGVSIGKAMDNLNIMIGSTYEQGFIKFNQFFKVYVQSDPELPTASFRSSEAVCQKRCGRNGALLGLHDA